jgi:catechol 2,3-dioxygenase-like lactoylglutathione lyase family enzyme
MQRHSRREVLGILSAGALAIRAAGTPLKFGMLDHLEFFVSDVQKSAAFYARVFGNTVLKNNRTSRRYVKLGSGYMAIDTGQQIRVDHICAGIPGFEIAGVHDYLRQLGIEYRDYPSGKDLSVGEPDDGVRLQLANDNGWSALTGGTASPEKIQLEGESIFRSLGLNHILLNVPDPERSAAFYEKILGPVAQRNNNRIWFRVGPSRIGLLKTPEGQRAGVNHFCVSAAAFDYDSSMKKLAQAGANLETPEATGAPEFRDPDGYLVQVMRPR